MCSNADIRWETEKSARECMQKNARFMGQLFRATTKGNRYRMPNRNMGPVMSRCGNNWNRACCNR